MIRSLGLSMQEKGDRGTEPIYLKDPKLNDLIIETDDEVMVFGQVSNLHQD
jgi:hypothetical protein